MKNHYFKTITILFSLLLSIQVLIGQVQFKFRYFTVDEGIIHNNMRGVSQDSSGCIWFVTMDGLNKYNGSEYQTYRHNPEDSTTVLSNDVRYSFTDSKKNVWIGTAKGLNIYNSEFNNFKKFTHPDLKNELGIIADIAEDGNSVLWIGSSIGLVSYNLNTNKLKLHPINKYVGKKPDADLVERLIADNTNKIWLSFNNNGICIYDPESCVFRFFVNEPGNLKSLSDNNIERIYQDNNHNIWVGTYNGGLNKFNPVDSSFTRIVIDKDNSLTSRVRAMFEDDEGYLYFGTRGGLYIMENTNKFTLCGHTDHVFSKLNQNSVCNAYRDNVGGVWLGTYAGGANYADLYRKPFSLYEAKVDNEYFLKNPVVYAITEDKNGNLWIGTDGGLNFLNRKSGKYKYFTHDPNNPNSLTYNDIKCLEWDNEDNLWIGTNRGGLVKYNLKSKKFEEKYMHDPDNPNSL